MNSFGAWEDYFLCTKTSDFALGIEGEANFVSMFPIESLQSVVAYVQYFKKKLELGNGKNYR